MHHIGHRLTRAQEPLRQLPLDAINSARLRKIRLQTILNLQTNQHHTDGWGRRPPPRVGTNWGES